MGRLVEKDMTEASAHRQIRLIPVLAIILGLVALPVALFASLLLAFILRIFVVALFFPISRDASMLAGGIVNLGIALPIFCVLVYFAYREIRNWAQGEIASIRLSLERIQSQKSTEST